MVWVDCVWVGHSLRLRSGQALSDAFDVEAEFGPTHKGKTKVKGVGQECPTHTVVAVSHPLKTAKGGAASHVRKS
jgi:hypothetical protein